MLMCQITKTLGAWEKSWNFKIMIWLRLDLMAGVLNGMK